MESRHRLMSTSDAATRRIFKVTRERVRQVEAKAIRKLQHPVRSRKTGRLSGEYRSAVDETGRGRRRINYCHLQIK